MSDEQKLPPVYADLEKRNISDLELLKQSDLERLNPPDIIQPVPTPLGKWENMALEERLKAQEIERQKILRGINEIDAEISMQKKAHQNEFNTNAPSQEKESAEQKRGLVSKEKTKKLRDQFVGKAKHERQRDQERER